MKESDQTISRAARVNFTLPAGLFKEAKELIRKRHYNGMSDLIQTLIRNAVEQESKQFSLQNSGFQRHEGVHHTNSI